MTSDQIKQKDTLELSLGAWLKEIAYQLALLNERPANPPPEAKPVQINKPFKVVK
jgi:hypothetical protein